MTATTADAATTTESTYAPITALAPTRTRDPRLVRNRDVLDSLWIAAVLTAGSYALALAHGWIATVNPLEAFAVATSYSCTWLVIQQRRFNYPIGMLSTTAYCLLFLQQGLYASAVLNAYLTPTLLYGWIRWRADADTRPVTRVAMRGLPVYLVATGVAYIGAATLTSVVGGSFAFADSVILVGTILAQFLLDNKKVETWIVWFVVDIVAIWLYFSSGLAIAGLQFVFFLVVTVLGFRRWWLAMATDRPLEALPS